jgi:transposase
MTVVRRYEVSDEDWALIAPLLPKQERGGKWNDHRTVMNGMFWVLRSGSAWRDMPERYGKWQTIYDRFVRWRLDGTLDKIAAKLRERLHGEGRIEWEMWCVDGTNVRAAKAAAGARKKTDGKTSRKTTG